MLTHLSRRTFLLSATVVALFYPKVSWAAPSLVVQLREYLPGWESFQSSELEKVVSRTEVTKLREQLARSGVSSASLREMWQADYRAGKLCEVRGVMLARSECVAYAVAMRG
jgi:hypothetical protein